LDPPEKVTWIVHQWVIAYNSQTPRYSRMKDLHKNNTINFNQQSITHLRYM